MFNQVVAPYQTALDSAGYSHKLKYEKLDIQKMNKKSNKKNKNRKRRIFWFNPPYDMAVKTNVGKKFLEIIDKCFPPGHILRPYFNRHTCKISYRTLPNMYAKISVHNHKVTKMYNDANKPPAPPRRWRGRPRRDEQLQQRVGQFVQGIRAEVDANHAAAAAAADNVAVDDDGQHHHVPQQQQQAGCNCETGVETCPMNGNCLVTNVVYSATVETLDVLDEPTEEQSYTGLAESWKARLYQHRSSFNHRHVNQTSLSNHIWKLKDEDLNYRLTWGVLGHARPYNLSMVFADSASWKNILYFMATKQL